MERLRNWDILLCEGNSLGLLKKDKILDREQEVLDMMVPLEV